MLQCRLPEPHPLPDSDMTLFAVIEEAIRANGGPMIPLDDLCVATGYDRGVLKERVLRVCTPDNYFCGHTQTRSGNWSS